MIRDRLRAAAAVLERRATRPDGSVDRRLVLLAFGAAYAFFVVTYLAVNSYSVDRRAWTLYLPGEARIPFIPELELIYATGYLIPAVVIFRLPDARAFVRVLAAFVLTLAVAYATYLLFPVYLERPEVVVDSLPALMLSMEYLDPSYNHFPSLHAAIAWLVYLSCRRGVRRPALLLAWVIAVSASTVFVKQHYVVDIAYGIALAVAAWWIAGRAIRPSGDPLDLADAADVDGGAAALSLLEDVHEARVEDDLVSRVGAPRSHDL